MDVEQVGGGAAGYLLRRLRTDLGRSTSAEDVAALDLEAGKPGQLVLAAIAGPDVLGLALLRLPERSVEVVGALPGRDDVVSALLDRATHDARAAGVPTLLRIEP